MEKITTQNFDIPDSHKLAVYESTGGYQGIRKALDSMTPDAVIGEVKKSNLRGLGGAGFLAGMKWGFIPKSSPLPKYLVVNCDEAEPGTFKDKYIISLDPHRLLEGMMIAAYAIGAHKAYIFVRGEYVRPYDQLAAAVEEAYAKGYLGERLMGGASGAGNNYRLDVVMHRGAGAYICGEESALLEAIEGKKGWPRLKPPFPAVVGLFGCPTVINNVETIACVPAIIEKGAEWFAKLGTAKCGGTRIFCVSGHVERPGIYELPVSVTLRSLIYDHAGGIRGGKKLKAVVPGGISAPILTANEIDVMMDFDSLRAAGTMAGSAGVIVMDEDTDMVEALRVASRFFAHESCGQCSPCREGSGWMHKIIRRIYEGHGRAGDLDNLLSIAKNISGTTICALGDAAAMPVISYITKFREEFENAITSRQSSVVGRQYTHD
ncbi:MAG: NADH-quinone oxidoreductase subunit NuoF [Candidatus Omnitrophica bacterium]|nr:NADH-quinone oxidoreductase subunit NuoF [Candidatus Omnitrophota bacterium]